MIGRGELIRVDLLAVSTLPVTVSMYCKMPWRRFLLPCVKYTYSPTVATPSTSASTGLAGTAASAKTARQKK